MKKITFYLLLILVFLTNCQRNAVIKTHGISYLENRQKLIIVNKSNKNDAIEILGRPATKGMTNDNMWIYIERTKVRGKFHKLGRTHLSKNNVLVLEFNKFGVLDKKDFYNKDDMKNIRFAEKITENEIKKENFIYSFLSSVREKMEARKK
jgi:outer membrane protein assembly factor BamE (lipoprotein component of BamABCDE complex)